MTADKSFEISKEALENAVDLTGPRSLLDEINDQLIDNMNRGFSEAEDRLFNGRFPEPQPPVYEEPIMPRSPQDNVGLFQQKAPTWGTSVTPPDNMSADREKLKRMFADKLNTHAPEPKPETQVVPRRNGKRTAAAKAAGNAAISKQAVSAAQGSAHTHSIGGGMMQQGKLQAGALNIAGRDVKECLDCGALVLDDVAHRKQHAARSVEMADLLTQLADARDEIRELKKARTRKVPRPKSKNEEVVTRAELLKLKEEARAMGALTPEEERLRRNMTMTYGEAIQGDILQPRSFVGMKMHGPGEL